MEQLKIGLVGTYQLNFDAAGAERVFRESVDSLGKLEPELGFELVVADKLLLNAGDAAAARRRFEAEGVDFLIVQVSSFAAGDIIVPLARTNARLGLWAVPETTSSGPLPLNSFCGINMYGSIIGHHLKHYKIPFKWFYGKASDRIFRERFDVTVRALGAVKNLSNSRIALIGGVAPGFKDLTFDERALEARYGVEVLQLELAEVLDLARAQDEREVGSIINDKWSWSTNIDVDQGEFERSARLYLAFRKLAEQYGLRAMGISCWPEFQKRYQIKPCSVVGQLNEDGVVAGCEGDLPSALSMLMLNLLNGDQSMLMDLSSFDLDDNTIMMWHCGPAAPRWARKGEIAHRKVSIGREDLADMGIANDIVFKPGKVTVMRTTGEGDRALVFTGMMLEDQKEGYHGSRGWMGELEMAGQRITALDLINTVMVQRFQHHFPIASGDLTDVLMELFSWLDIQVLTPVKYQTYMQRAR